MRTHNLIAGLTLGALMLLGGWMPAHAQNLDMVLSSSDQTVMSGDTVTFTLTITNLTNSVLDVSGSNISFSDFGKADFDALNDVNDNSSDFLLDYIGDITPTGDPTSITITDMFDFTVNLSSILSTPARPLDPTLDYASGTYTLTSGVSGSGTTVDDSTNFTVRLAEPAASTPEPGLAALLLTSATGALLICHRQRAHRKR